MEHSRTKYQGLKNILLFNQHNFLFALVLIAVYIILAICTNGIFAIVFLSLAVSIMVSIIIALIVSHYIYDRTNLYELKWMQGLQPGRIILNVNAGFDETSHLIQDKFPASNVISMDFYDPLKHTERSIKKARILYPPNENIIKIRTDKIDNVYERADNIFLIFSAHEIRDIDERVIFFTELKRLLTDNGKICVVEHLRDLPNLLAYNIGFLHFHMRRIWHHTFKQAGLRLTKEIKLNPFIRLFELSYDH